MRKRKVLIVITFLLIGVIGGYAQDKVLGVIIDLANGEKVECRLVDKPKMVYDGTTITLTAEGVKLEFTPEGIQKVTMGEVDNAAGINEAKLEHGSIEMKDGFVRLSGFEVDDEVKVYSVAGLLLAVHKISTDGSFVLPVASLPSGISIIKTKKQSIKITK